jgi:hypothetical protein
MATIDAGTELTCTDPDCDCSLIVQNPCPKGENYRCGCGAELIPASEIPEKSEASEIH